MHSELPYLAKIWGPSFGCIGLPRLPRLGFICLVRSVGTKPLQLPQHPFQWPASRACCKATALHVPQKLFGHQRSRIFMHLRASGVGFAFFCSLAVSFRGIPRGARRRSADHGETAVDSGFAFSFDGAAAERSA